MSHLAYPVDNRYRSASNMAIFMSPANVIDLNALLHKDLDKENLGPRERILVAALKLFVKQGYFNTNVPDLSRESKCSVGSIYHHYKNKEEVAAALYSTGIAYFRLALEKQLTQNLQVEQLLKTIVRFFLEFTEQHVELSKYLWLSRHTEFMSGVIRHPTNVGFDSLGRTLTKAIKGGIRNKQLRPMKAHEIWSVLFGIPLSYARDWLDGYNTAPPGQVADTLAEACWRALKA